MTSIGEIIPGASQPGVDTGFFTQRTQPVHPVAQPVYPGYPGIPVAGAIGPMNPHEIPGAQPSPKRDWVLWIKQLLIATCFFLCINNPVVEGAINATEFTALYKLILKTSIFLVLCGISFLML